MTPRLLHVSLPERRGWGSSQSCPQTGRNSLLLEDKAVELCSQPPAPERQPPPGSLQGPCPSAHMLPAHSLGTVPARKPVHFLLLHPLQLRAAFPQFRARMAPCKGQAMTSWAGRGTHKRGWTSGAAAVLSGPVGPRQTPAISLPGQPVHSYSQASRRLCTILGLSPSLGKPAPLTVGSAPEIQLTF